MNYEISATDQLDYKIKALEFKVERLQLRIHDDVPKAFAAKSTATPPNDTLVPPPPPPTPITIIETANGKIRGAKRRTIYDQIYYAFEHIPYAQPPVGELRFRAPKPVVNWRGIRDCTQYGERPMQRVLGDGRVDGTEDCLYLNVYTNNPRPSGKPRPVMVWIYGGGFVCGEANPEWYGPDYFMAKDVVLVTIQYRLGAMGFLSVKDPQLHVPGNAGIKDQILALKWIRRNCHSFGGNPDCVTVFGESAGSVSTHLLMLSEEARGLFHRAIMQSGTATMPLSSFDCTRHVRTLAIAAGYKGANVEKDIVRYLQEECTAKQIVAAEKRCGLEGAMRGERIMFGICVEPYVTAHTVLPRHPTELLMRAWGNSIPLMVGGTTNEGIFFLPLATRFPLLALKPLETCTEYVPRQAVANRDSAECRDKGMRLRRLHVRGDTPNMNDYAELVSYSLFWHPIQRAIEARLLAGQASSQKTTSNTLPNAKTYLYRYDFATSELRHPFGLMGELSSAPPGVAHTAELGALFHNVMSRRCERQTREYRHIEQMISIWTAFATTGNPNDAFKENHSNGNSINHLWPCGKRNHQQLKWPSLERQKMKTKKNIKSIVEIGKDADTDDALTNWQCLNISDELSIIPLPEMAKLRIWSELYVQTHSPPLLPANADDSDFHIRLQSSL